MASYKYSKLERHSHDLRLHLGSNAVAVVVVVFMTEAVANELFVPALEGMHKS